MARPDGPIDKTKPHMPAVRHHVATGSTDSPCRNIAGIGNLPVSKVRQGGRSDCLTAAIHIRTTTWQRKLAEVRKQDRAREAGGQDYEVRHEEWDTSSQGNHPTPHLPSGQFHVAVHGDMSASLAATQHPASRLYSFNRLVEASGCRASKPHKISSKTGPPTMERQSNGAPRPTN